MTRHAARTILLFGILALVAGLAQAGDAPALPPGLENESTEEAPALPPGLGEQEGPGLPPGLETEVVDNETTGDIHAGEPSKAAAKFPLHGFWENRAGVRLQDDPAQSKDSSIAETRLQLETEKVWDRVVFEFTGDIFLDGIAEEPDADLRRLRLTWTPVNTVDIRVGRQVLTWGTGDMLFINDMFPKDWQSFFIGRDVDYLKAPADSLRIGWFNKAVNVDFVYTPQFVHDRFITGERISFWDPMRQTHSGDANQVNADPPETWFEDDEYALRLYRSIGSAEIALYGYSGYWKSPAGQQMTPMRATFPKLRVYGASVRGPVAKGIANIELGYYDSYQDKSGTDPLVNNSEFRVLLGYERELATEFTCAMQYYLEHMNDHEAYMDSRYPQMPERDQDRHVLTFRLTKLLMNQNFIASLFTYYSPSDGDAYLRPGITYKASDHWTLNLGGNIFTGRADDTFFGQFENNTNAYAAARLAF